MSAADRFLEQNILQLAVDDVAEDDTNCIICYDAYNSEKQPVRVQPCGHIFCLYCLTTHVQGRQPSSHTCPLCRSQLFQPDVTPDHVLTARVHRILDQVFQGFEGDPRLLGGAWEHIDDVVSGEHFQDDDVDTIVSYLRIFVAETLRLYNHLDAESLDSDSEYDDDEDDWVEDNADDVDVWSSLLHDERQERTQLTHQDDEPDDDDDELESQPRYCPRRHRRHRVVLDSDDEEEDDEQGLSQPRQRSQRGIDPDGSRKRRRIIIDSDDEDDDLQALHVQGERSSSSNTGDCPRSKRRRVVLDDNDEVSAR